MRLFAGALLERPPGPKYTSELRFAELAPKAPLPKPTTLAKWRKSLPAGFEVGLRAPEECWRSTAGPLHANDELRAALRWLAEATDALEASLLVISTGAAITTGARDKERVRQYFAEIPHTEDCSIVWRPTGLWEPAALQRMASELSIIGGIDAIDDPVPSADLVYATLVAEGLRRSFSHAQLIDVLEKLRDSDASRAFVTIDSAQSFREARLLRALSEGRA
jgi:hypothetical protein